MNRRTWCVFICWSCLLGTAIAADPERHVVILSLEGCPPTVFQDEYAHNLRWLWTHGSYSWRAATVKPNGTLAAEASLLTGLLPAKHHMDWDAYDPGKGVIEVPTLLDLAHAAGLQTLFIASQRMFWHLDKPDLADFSSIPRSIQEETGVDPQHPEGQPRPRFDTVKAIRHGFDRVTPNVCYIQFAQPGATGRALGWNSDEYLYALRQLDQQIGLLLAMWQRSGYLENTVVFVTSDHGGGGTTPETVRDFGMTIPWVAWGKNIKPNHEIATPICIDDTAATAAFILKLKIPRNWDGQIITEIFR